MIQSFRLCFPTVYLLLSGAGVDAKGASSYLTVLSFLSFTVASDESVPLFVFQQKREEEGEDCSIRNASAEFCGTLSVKATRQGV